MYSRTSSSDTWALRSKKLAVFNFLGIERMEAGANWHRVAIVVDDLVIQWR